METKPKELDFKYPLMLLSTMLGKTMNEGDYYDIAMFGWRKIGNREIQLYVMQEAKVEDCVLELPCNFKEIEAVTVPVQICTTRSAYPSGLSVITKRQYFNLIGARFSPKNDVRSFKEVYGEYIPYKLDGTTLIFDKNVEEVNVYYKGLRLNEEGFPYLSEKEAEAIAYYCAFILEQRRVMARIGDANTMAYLKQEWNRLCRDARVPEKYSQNAMDSVLNVLTSMNRKWYNRSLKSYTDI